jgi:hypothetical protein
MPSTILSDNGVTSGSAGFKTTAASDGALALQTTTAGGTATTALTIDTSQNVGIGISSLTYKLDVSVTGNNGIRTTSSAGQQLYLGNTGGDAVVGTLNNYSLGLLTNGGVRATIDSSGNVGIGTTSPVGKFQVVGTGGNVYFDNNGFVNSTQALDTSSAGGRFLGYSSQGKLGDIGIEQTTTGAKGGYIRFGTCASGSNSPTDRMIIDSSGNVGIGTTSPSYKLHVVSSSASTPLLIDGGTNTYFGIKNSSQTAYLGAVGTVMYFENNGSERMRIDSNGVVLVGQTSTFSQGSPIFVAGSSSSNQPIGHRGYGGVDGTYVDWLISAPYQGNTTEQNRIKSSISSNATNSGLVFMISDGAGLSTQTQSFRINRSSCTVIGSLSKGSGSFKIDHPLTAKKDTHHLVHSFIEGPQADLIYRGKVNLVAGTATVNIDTASGMTEGTFVALCRDVQCFTTNESDWTPVRGSVTGNILTIEAQDNTSTASISWMVIGERQDKHMYETDWTDKDGKVIVEPLKDTREQA